MRHLKASDKPPKAPSTCICSEDSITRIDKYTDTKYRFLCKSCNSSYYHPREWLTGESANDARLLDKVVRGQGYRGISDELEGTEHEADPMTIFNRVRPYAGRLRIFTDDILSTLRYGEKWEIDETCVKTRRPWVWRVKHPDKGGYCPGFWLTGVLDRSSRVIIGHIMTVHRPGKHDLYGLFMNAIHVAGLYLDHLFL